MSGCASRPQNLLIWVPAAPLAPWASLECAPIALRARHVPAAVHTRIRIATRAPTPIASALVKRRAPFGDMAAPVAFRTHDSAGMVALRARRFSSPVAQLTFLSCCHSSSPISQRRRWPDCARGAAPSPPSKSCDRPRRRLWSRRMRRAGWPGNSCAPTLPRPNFGQGVGSTPLAYRASIASNLDRFVEVRIPG